MGFSTQQKKSHITGQDFLWLANYKNGQQLCEYDLKTRIKNDFYSINKSALSQFGLFGQGMELYFDTETGGFNLNGLELLLSYKVKDGKEYNLTGYGNGLYNDIITYKDAWTDAKLIGGGRYSSQIHQYNFGFKKKLVYADGMEFALQIVCCIPYNERAYLEIKIVPNQNLDGQLYIKKIGRIAESIQAPLKEDHALILNWIIN